MTQAEMMAKIKGDENQAKQIAEVSVMINDAIRNEMGTFMKLVQFDVMTEIHKKAAAENAGKANTAEKELTNALNTLLSQVDKNLNEQIIKAFKEITAMNQKEADEYLKSH